MKAYRKLSKRTRFQIEEGIFWGMFPVLAIAIMFYAKCQQEVPMDRMTWERFKEVVEHEMAEKGIPADTEIHFIEVWQPIETVCVTVHDDGGLYIE